MPTLRTGDWTRGAIVGLGLICTGKQGATVDDQTAPPPADAGRGGQIGRTAIMGNEPRRGASGPPRAFPEAQPGTGADGRMTWPGDGGEVDDRTVLQDGSAFAQASQIGQGGAP